MKRIRFIFICLIIVASGFAIYRFFNSNRWIRPMKGVSSPCTGKEGYQNINFGSFKFVVPNNWKDNGFIIGEEGELHGKLTHGAKIIHYEYGLTAISETETLNEYLYNSRNNLFAMGNEKVLSETDSSREVTYEWSINPESSDTIKTGLLTDSIRRLFNENNYNIPVSVSSNYYSLTKYNDSIYFIAINVPEEISGSEVLNFDSLGYNYNLVTPKNMNNGYVKIVVTKDGFFRFALWSKLLDSINQQVIINAGLSMKFNNSYRLDDKLFFEQGD